MEYVIGCDIGSQAVKAVLLSAEGQIAGEASAGYEIQYPQPAWAEQDAENWMQALTSAIRGLLKASRVSSSQVSAIGLDAQVDGVVAVDHAGRSLGPAVIWMDRRATAQVERVRQACDPRRIFQLSGLNLDPYHCAPKINWLADERREDYEKARYFLLPGSYIAYQLTHELGVDPSNASSMLLMDVRAKAWSEELCACFGISMDRLAPIYPATTVIGTLRPEIARQMGLRASTRIVLGCGDEHAACLGAGVIQAGLVCDITGTAEPVGAASIEPLFDDEGLVETHCHAHPGLWLMENPGFVSGGNYRWFRDEFGVEELSAGDEQEDAYRLLDQAAQTAAAGSEGLVLLPCLMGAMTPTWNPQARGAFVGFSLNHQKKHFARAILEGSAYALRDITERMQQMGMRLHEIRAVGGGAKSTLWRQIKADVTGLPVTLLNTVETTALGAAMLALVGGGYIASLEQAVEMTVKPIERREPNPKSQMRYEDYYQLYRQTYFSLQGVFEQAARIKP